MDFPFESQILQLNSKIQNQNKTQQDSLQKLLVTERKMSDINVLMVQKLSIIVSEYFDAIQRLQMSEKQLSVLIEYNKRLIEVLNSFQQQQKKLLTRLRRMEEINFQYMKQYCIVKGRQFKMPGLPQHKSIFQTIDLHNFTFKEREQPKPVADLDYKKQLINILENSFLTNQTQLLNKIQAQLTKQNNEQQHQLLMQIKSMICSYNNAVVQRKQQQLFTLLLLRFEIRAKVQQYYERKLQTDIKPNYDQQHKLIDKIINLHAKFQQMNKQTIIEYLKEQKQSRTSFEKSRIQVQSTIAKKYKQLTAESQILKQQITNIKTISIGNQDKLKQEIKQKQTQIQNLSQKIKYFQIEKRKKCQQIEKGQINIKQLKQNIQQLQNIIKLLQSQIDSLKLKQQTKCLQTQTEFGSKFTRVTWDILAIDPQKNIQQDNNDHILKINQLEVKLKQLVSSIDQKNQTIIQLENHIKISFQQHKQQKQSIQNQLNTISRQLSLVKKQSEKLQQNKYLVEDLVNKVWQAISLVSTMDLSEAIKRKLQQISKKLQFFMAQYQMEIQWNIEKQAPGYFQQFSMITNMNQQQIISDMNKGKNQKNEKRGYSFQLQNVQLIKQMIDSNKKPIRNELEIRSQFIERPVELQLQNVVLDLSNEADDKNMMEQYNNLYKIYQQVLQCLEMQEKKSKTIQLQYQKFVEIIYQKQQIDPQKYSLEKQIFYLTKLSIQQKETIQTQRKQYNEMFRDFQSQFKSKAASSLKSLRAHSFDVKMDKKLL